MSDYAHGYESVRYLRGIDLQLLVNFLTAPEWGFIGLLLLYGWYCTRESIDKNDRNDDDDE